MTDRNPALERIQGSYLFVEVDKYKKAYLEAHPEAKLINLGIGDTTQPLPPVITDAMKDAVAHLGDLNKYSGYGPPFGMAMLREAIASCWYGDRICLNEVYISDGIKCDIGRLQQLFPSNTVVAVQNPVYPAYVSSSVISGKSGLYAAESLEYQKIVYLRCEERKSFFPDLENAPHFDLLFFCSPNNPTGAVATRKQLEELVKRAHQKKFMILFDAAYSAYIQDDSLTRSIYEIEGAKEVAIELGSFSKIIGFSGVRLGWSVIPKELKFVDGSYVYKDWEQIISAFFNGASVVAQKGGAALLYEPGMISMHRMIGYYLENAKILKSALQKRGLKCMGGDHSPYIWVGFRGKGSWEVFHHLLNHLQIVTIPGVGFGSAGEGYVRISALGNRSDVELAAKKISRAEYLIENR